MSLLQLENIGKIYASHGTVAVGICGVNLCLDIGEFVAVTGKSGSGKTTLLNVLSGMDTYEEGELYIASAPTSHYTQTDWEEYRQRYISFIFQDYNIMESFTVLQNVELSLMHLNAKERRARALALIERVGLTAFAHHKGSKLSGGQKQRTVIARALAKDSPILLADEPTGNLDSQSAKEVLALLKEISKEKLVVLVTHSFDQVQEYATRQIRIFDGHVEADEVLQPDTARPLPQLPDPKPPTKRSTLRKGFSLGRHRFFATPKLSLFLCFVLLLAMLGSFAVTASLAPNLKIFQPNYIFHPIPGRVILSRQDGKSISATELTALSQTHNAGALPLDFFLDVEQTLYPDPEQWNRYIYGRFDLFGTYTPDAGRLPQAEHEVFLHLPLSWKSVYGEGTLARTDLASLPQATVCGVSYFQDNTKEAKLFVTREGYAFFARLFLLNDWCDDSQTNVSCPVVFHYNQAGNYHAEFSPHAISVDPTLQGNEAYLVSDYCTSVSAQNAQILQNGDTLKEITAELSLQDATTGTNVPALQLLWERCRGFSADDSSYRRETLFISADLLPTLLVEKEQTLTQASLFFADEKTAQQKMPLLKQAGYLCASSDSVYTDLSTQTERLFVGIAVLFLWCLLLLFLGMFLVLCSSRAMMHTKGDLAILRSMGIARGIVRVSTYAQMLYACIPAGLLTVLLSRLLYALPKTNAIFPYLQPWQYLPLLLGGLLLSLYLAKRHNKKMFSDSVRKTMRGGETDDPS